MPSMVICIRCPFLEASLARKAAEEVVDALDDGVAVLVERWNEHLAHLQRSEIATATGDFPRALLDVDVRARAAWPDRPRGRAAEASDLRTRCRGDRLRDLLQLVAQFLAERLVDLAKGRNKLAEPVCPNSPRGHGPLTSRCRW